MNATELNQLPLRCYAHINDRPIIVDGENPSHGVSPSPDAIGGFYGIGWYEAFRCHKTGEYFRVHCSDGVYGGKSAHSDDDLMLIEAGQLAIMVRTRQEAERSAEQILLTQTEWALMLGRIFDGWLDPVEYNQKHDRSIRSMEDGQIGTINGVPVVVVSSN